MKPLKPSHREKKRYLLIKGKDVSKKSIEGAILEFVGVLGFAEASPTFVKIKKASSSSKDDEGHQIVLAINRGSLDKVRTSFLMSDNDLDIVKVTGSVGKVK